MWRRSAYLPEEISLSGQRSDAAMRSEKAVEAIVVGDDEGQKEREKEDSRLSGGMVSDACGGGTRVGRGR